MNPGVAGWVYHQEMRSPSSEAIIIRMPIIKGLEYDNSPIFSNYTTTQVVYRTPEGYISGGKHIGMRPAINSFEFINKRRSRMNALLSLVYLNKPAFIYHVLTAMQLTAMNAPFREDDEYIGYQPSNRTLTRGFLDSPIGQSDKKPFNLTVFDYSARSILSGGKLIMDDEYVDLARINFYGDPGDESIVTRSVTDLREMRDEEYNENLESILYSLDLQRH